MITKKQTAEALTERFEKKDVNSGLDRERFQTLFYEAVRDYYPGFRERHAGQSIYGISFEIGYVVQKIYADCFKTYLYFNTEERYQEKIKDCGEDEKSYYRFEVWAEWEVVCAESPLFERLQEYLELNSLYICSIAACYEGRLKEAALTWYQDNQRVFEDAFRKECRQIRGWMAQALGKLRQEGFWEAQAAPGLYVIPFGGECDIRTEELLETFQIMNPGNQDTEYPGYLKSCDLE